MYLDGTRASKKSFPVRFENIFLLIKVWRTWKPMAVHGKWCNHADRRSRSWRDHAENSKSFSVDFFQKLLVGKIMRKYLGIDQTFFWLKNGDQTQMKNKKYE